MAAGSSRSAPRVAMARGRLSRSSSPCCGPSRSSRSAMPSSAAVVLLRAVGAVDRALRSAEGRSDGLPAAAERAAPARHRRHRHGYLQPHHLCAAHRSHHRGARHAALGAGRHAHRRARRLLRGPARPGARALSASSCARPTCCRPFRSSSSPSRWSRCSARACRASSLAIAFVNMPDLSSADAQPGAVASASMRYVEAAYRRRALGRRHPARATSSPTPWRRCWRSSRSISAGRCC